MNIPLVSEYKIPFILQRIIQTFFGGLNTETNGLPVKLAIFLLAPVVGITTSCLIDNHQIDSYIAVLVTALFGFFFTLLIQVLSMVQLYQVSALVLPDGSVKKSSVINRLLPVARFHSKTLIILTCVLSSSLMGIITHVFKIEHIQAHVHGNHLLALCVFLLVWFTTAIAHHSLTLGPPPETASYLMTFSKINSLNRPLHLLSLPVIVILFPSGFLPCTLLICCLPFLWLLGIVPPVSALLYYLLEQANMILFAGSCSSDFLALLISVTASSLVFVACHWTLHGWKFLLATSLATFLLSNKWISNWSQLKSIPFAMKTVVCVGGIVGISWIPDSWESLPLVFALVGLVGFTSVVHYSQQVYIGNQVKNPASALMDIRTPIINLTVNTARIVLHIGKHSIRWGKKTKYPLLRYSTDLLGTNSRPTLSLDWSGCPHSCLSSTPATMATTGPSGTSLTHSSLLWFRPFTAWRSTNRTTILHSSLAHFCDWKLCPQTVSSRHHTL